MLQDLGRSIVTTSGTNFHQSFDFPLLPLSSHELPSILLKWSVISTILLVLDDTPVAKGYSPVLQNANIVIDVQHVLRNN